MAWLDELYLLAFRQGLLAQLESHAQHASVDIPKSLMEIIEPLKKDIEPEILSGNKMPPLLRMLCPRTDTFCQNI